MSRLSPVASLLAAVVVTGCAPAHVLLATPPAPEAPLEQRRDYYDEHRPMAVRSGRAGHLQGPGSFLLLEDGTRVEWPLDLLPVVYDNSPTARAALRAEEEEGAALAWWLAAGGLYGGGLVVMSSSLALLPLMSPDPDGLLPAEAVATVVGVMLAGGALSFAGTVPMLMAFGAGSRAALERDTAFLTYERSLRERLALSKDDVAPRPAVAVQNDEGDFELR